MVAVTHAVMKKILIVKAGCASPAVKARYGDFEQWIGDCAGLRAGAVTVVEAFSNRLLPAPTAWAGVIVTGSHAMVTDSEPWIEQTAQWIAGLVESQTPFLGICFGHQLLAHAVGGVVGYHPRGREVGTVPMAVCPQGRRDPLFSTLPDAFPAHALHAQTVLELPRDAALLVANDHEPHHAFRIGKCAWGVQFHPEFSAGIMEVYIEEQSGLLAREGHDVKALRAGVSDTAAAASLLKRFVTASLENGFSS